MVKKILFTLTVIVLCFSTTLFAVEYDVENYKINAVVNDDGSMDVTEYLKYHFDENMNGLYRDVLYKYTFNGQKNDMQPTSSRYQASGIENINVYISDTSFENMVEAKLQDENTLSNGMNNVFSISDRVENGYRTKIKAYSPVSEGSYKYVKFEYTIKDVVVNYSDYAEFYWNFIGKDWECYISNFELYVKFPISENLKAYGHTYANIDNFNIVGNQVSMKVNGISEETAVDIRSIFPNTYMGNVSKNINENYNFTELANIEKQMDKNKENYALSNKIWIGYALINIIIFIYLIIKASNYANKNKKSYKTVEHYTDLPDTYSLGEYSCIKNIMFGYSDPNLIIATILDLSNRKYIKLESLKKSKILKDTYEYYVSVDTKKNLDALTDYEKEVLNYIFAKKLENKIDLTDFENNRFELNERFKELGLDYSLGAKYRKVCTSKTSENDKKMYNPVPNSIWKSFFACLVITLVIAFINIFIISPIPDKALMVFVIAFIGIFEFAVLGLLIATVGKSIKDEYVYEYNKLLGLEKYLKEYSLIKERYPIELVLWEKYLVFATLFGIADKVSKEFKEELLKQGYDEDYIYTTYPYIHMGIYSHALTTSVSTMSGTASSGGYSGGGGGGRRWRWRRSFLSHKIKCI
ncbi:MAG: hypothetical protein K0R72_220 [Clostridia bacterium]|jgi:uncharacterized membrane protein|nr:hypothetical protein [Clostridia bacterium]